ncbi:MAG: MBL fold metallo-hydrolase [Nitrospirales bacterium]|nr:MBL fold metallo-hydrolase [Nitrospirales bacterium]NKB82840.1 MBL fold metallo-hydrolase [Nitrospirales bacterium]
MNGVKGTMKQLVFFLLIGVAVPAYALDPGPTDVYVRVVDVGAGLCTITAIPDHHYMIYDAGHWQGGRCLAAAREIIEGETIDLLILSHSDADHLGDAQDILKQYTVRQVIRTGFVRTSGTWINMNERMGPHAVQGGSILNLQTADLIPGTTIQVGEAEVVLVAGWKAWTDPGPPAAEKHNAMSIVVRLLYHGQSVLFTGDTIGRRLSDPPDACKDAEARMVQNSADVPLQADVLIAPHHGGNNGSSTCFIRAVNPTFVIFSAGHRYHHPSHEAAQRYLDHGLPVSHLFRTDRGDDEGGAEWSHGRVAGCRDARGDDDVEILLRSTLPPVVQYQRPSTGTCHTQGGTEEPAGP